LKAFYILLFTCFVVGTTIAQQDSLAVTSETTTYYLIRHAEKDRSDTSNRNPGLTKKGFFRADRWAELFKNISLDAVYSTNYDRTLMTASPTASAKELQIQTYDPRKLYSEEFQEATHGKSVLVVGHSNTTPSFVNRIINEEKFSNMSDNDNSSLFIVTLMGEHKDVKVLHIN